MKYIKKQFKILNVIIILSGCLLQIKAGNTSPDDTVIVKKLIEKSSAYRQINPDSALILANEAFEYAQQSKNIKYISLAMQSLGRSLIQQENFEKATDYFLKSIKIEEELGNQLRIADLSDDMGYIYYLMERFPTSLEYYTKALEIFENKADSTGIAKVLSHIGNLHNSRKYCETRTNEQQKTDHETAVSYYLKSLEICKKIKNEEGIVNLYLNLGNVYKKLNKTDIAYDYLQKALDYYIANNDPDGMSSVYFNLGLLYTLLKDYEKAIDCYQKCESISEEYNLKQGIQFLFAEMAHTYEQAGDCIKSKDYYIKYMTLRDSIYNSTKSKQIFELETKYQTEKKEKEILRLSLEKKRRNFYISLLSVILLFIIITAWYILLRSRQKRLLAEQAATIREQKIKELEQEKMLVATQSVLTGEETERRRLARDLHDGLGGMLSGIKLKLTNMKGNFILDENGKSDFDNALEMLDKSVHELRQVAHNMMPEALIKFGLKDALGDFCSALDNPKGTKLVFRFYGEHKRINQTVEIALYRIAQELINNSFKHSGSSEILVDLVQEEDRISLAVEDNGKGFDTTLLSEFKGIGLSSLKSRVAALNGNIDIHSQPGKGTEIRVEFSID